MRCSHHSHILLFSEHLCIELYFICACIGHMIYYEHAYMLEFMYIYIKLIIRNPSLQRSLQQVKSHESIESADVGA